MRWVSWKILCVCQVPDIGVAGSTQSPMLSSEQPRASTTSATPSPPGTAGRAGFIGYMPWESDNLLANLFNVFYCKWNLDRRWKEKKAILTVLNPIIYYDLVFSTSNGRQGRLYWIHALRKINMENLLTNPLIDLNRLLSMEAWSNIKRKHF